MKIYDLTERIISFVRTNHLFNKDHKLLLAVSGGVDSVVLCYLCKQAGYSFAIAHCNFQLRGNDSIRDEKFVESLAQELGVPFHRILFDTRQYAEQHKLSTQEAARSLRYEWFENVRNEQGYDWILTAHHADDNIETVCMNFFRGTGIAGLTGIKPVNGKLIRPLLFARREELETFLKEINGKFVQDNSNLHDDYTRNFFRNTLLPQVKKVYPEAAQNLINNIQRFQEVEILYHREIERNRKKLLLPKDKDFCIPVLLLQKAPAYPTLLLEIAKPFGFTARQLPEMIRLLDSQPGKYIISATHRMLKDRKHLIISTVNNTATSAVIIDKEGSFLFEGGTLRLSSPSKFILSEDENVASINASLIQYPLILRPWRAGDYFYPLGMTKKKKLSRFLTDKKLSLADKEKVWVVEMNKKIIWVVGYRIDNRFKVIDKEKPVLLMERV